MLKDYQGIPTGETYTYESVIEKSRFIANIRHVDTVAEADKFIAEMRKKYYDATHNCYAYVLDDNVKFSDDGEPGGTAGLPMYNRLQAMHMSHVCVVVTRYFGGIKLGAGGLVRAYTGTMTDAFRDIPHWYFAKCVKAEVTVEYTSYQLVRRAIDVYCNVLDVEFTDKVTMSVITIEDSSNTIRDIVIETTNGKGLYKVTERVLESYVHKEDRF